MIGHLYLCYATHELEVSVISRAVKVTSASLNVCKTTLSCDSIAITLDHEAA